MCPDPSPVDLGLVEASRTSPAARVSQVAAARVTGQLATKLVTDSARVLPDLQAEHRELAAPGVEGTFPRRRPVQDRLSQVVRGPTRERRHRLSEVLGSVGVA